MLGFGCGLGLGSGSGYSVMVDWLMRMYLYGFVTIGVIVSRSARYGTTRYGTYEAVVAVDENEVATTCRAPHRRDEAR